MLRYHVATQVNSRCGFCGCLLLEFSGSVGAVSKRPAMFAHSDSILTFREEGQHPVRVNEGEPRAVLVYHSNKSNSN